LVFVLDVTITQAGKQVNSQIFVACKEKKYCLQEEASDATIRKRLFWGWKPILEAVWAF
jgi:hypothetical protein